jgi:hypothetical protein
LELLSQFAFGIRVSSVLLLRSAAQRRATPERFQRCGAERRSTTEGTRMPKATCDSRSKQ